MQFKVTPEICPVLWRSLSNMVPNLGIIGNVSKSKGILILQGDNDSLTLAQEAFSRNKGLLK